MKNTNKELDTSQFPVIEIVGPEARRYCMSVELEQVVNWFISQSLTYFPLAVEGSKNNRCRDSVVRLEGNWGGRQNMVNNSGGGC